MSFTAFNGVRMGRARHDLPGAVRGVLWGGFLLAIAALAGCVPRYRVHHTEDAFFQTAVRRMSDNVLGEGVGLDRVELNAVAMRKQGDSIRYDLVVEFHTTGDLLRIGPGESLILLVDSARSALARRGATRLPERGPWSRGEAATFPIDAQLLRSLGCARQVRVRVLGYRYYVDRDLTPSNLRRFRAFLGESPGADVATDSARLSGCGAGESE